ncbi:MAG TPA: glycosyltransferase family 39 protein [Solirubrobacteraceae bacterium]|nr:glycosyltransferase family 39 protein [Solirubrobacteraceae bacterium]
MQGATLSRPGGADHVRTSRRRDVRTLPWARIALAGLCLAALAGYFAFPTYPTYDSFYALLWGRDVLHLTPPDFGVYRGPTEHPLAIAFGVLCSLFGQGGARLMVLGSILSFVALVAGIYRLTRLCFGTVVAALAALLMLSRLFDANLAAQGYLDITFIALIVWATALEVQRTRWGTPVFALLAAAGLLRPDAWVLSGAYWLWCAWPAAAAVLSARRETPPPTSGAEGAAGATGTRSAEVRGGPAGSPPSLGRLLGYAALVAGAPLIWIACDTAVTGDPLYSLHSTAVLAAELERTQGFGAVLSDTWRYLVRIDKAPVVIGGIAGIAIGVLLTPRRSRVPLATLSLLLLVYVGEGAGGASVIDRYMLGTAAMLLPFCALAIGGWSLLERGSLLRRVWMAAGAALVLYGAIAAVSVTSLGNARTQLSYQDDFTRGLAAALHAPAVRAELRRCPVLTLPDNKLIPAARWILNTRDQHDILARSEARADLDAGRPALARRIEHASVGVYPLGAAVFKEAIVDIGDAPLVQAPPPGFRRIYTGRYYAIYGNC